MATAQSPVSAALCQVGRPKAVRRVLALCGSLRQASRSRVLLQACALLAPSTLHIEIHEGLGALPLFNPDLEADPPPAVLALWGAVGDADALLIASPEYAHGVTGVIKNALDWLVARTDLPGKPVALLNPSHRAEHADAALREILLTMSARLLPEASLRVAVTACTLDAPALARTDPFAGQIRALLQHIARELCDADR